MSKNEVVYIETSKNCECSICGNICEEVLKFDLYSAISATKEMELKNLKGIQVCKTCSVFVNMILHSEKLCSEDYNIFSPLYRIDKGKENWIILVEKKIFDRLLKICHGDKNKE